MFYNAQERDNREASELGYWVYLPWVRVYVKRALGALPMQDIDQADDQKDKEGDAK